MSHRRIYLPQVPVHVVQRGNNRCDIFRCRADYIIFMKILSDAALRFGLSIHGYVLMTTHVHLLVTPDQASALPGAMCSLGRRYVPYFNRLYQRTGTLFEGRYRTNHVVDESHWFNTLRYIELNPVRASLVTAPHLYPWSSYRAHALGAADDLLTPHRLYLSLGADALTRQQFWSRQCASPLSEEELAMLRAVGRWPISRPTLDPGSTPGRVRVDYDGGTTHGGR